MTLDTDEDHTLLAEVKGVVGPVEKLLLRPTRSGDDVQMRVKDEHLDIFCRYSFPVLFGITLIVFFARLPELPEQAPELRDLCRPATHE